MKRMAWHWTLAASAMALAFVACTVTEGDDDEDAGTGGTGGSTATGGTGGSTATGGTGGSAGTAGTGGAAGAAGAAGSGDQTCAEAYPGDDSCSKCFVEKCCAEVEACANEKDENGAAITQCYDSWGCFIDDCTDPANLPEGVTYEECKSNCDDGNFNVAYNDIVACLDASCYAECTVQ